MAPTMSRRRIPGLDRTCRRRTINIAENNGEAVFSAADDHDFCILRLRKRERCLDAAPAQIGIRNTFADCLLKGRDAICLYLLAPRFLRLSLNAVFELLDLVKLLRLAIDCGHNFEWQLNTENGRIENQDRVLQANLCNFWDPAAP